MVAFFSALQIKNNCVENVAFNDKFFQIGKI